MFSPEAPVHFHLPVFESSFMEDEIQGLLSLFQAGHPVDSNSGSDTNRSAYSVEERKRRRMISNRESARRSRWRKKRHVENLTKQVNRLGIENRELKNRLGLVSHQCGLIERETDQLSTEYLGLQQRLSCLHQILITMQLQ